MPTFGEIPGAFNLDEAAAHNGAILSGRKPLLVTTTPERWAFAAGVRLRENPSHPIESHQKVYIHLDATVEEGEIGVSVVNPECTELLSAEVSQSALRRTLEVTLDHPRAGSWLIIRNRAPGGVASRVKIHSIHAYVTQESTPGNADDPSLGRFSDHRIWLDVGAHLGEETFPSASANPRIRVYAFEPNLRVASHSMGRLPNYVVLPIAVAEHDGSAPLYINRNSYASSLLELAPEGLRAWDGAEGLVVESTVTVPTMRLDTFLNQSEIREVEYLKVDAQGSDLSVIRSAGQRLRDIERIKLEVQTTSIELYRNSSRKEEVVAYLNEAGFQLVSSEKQTSDQEENLTFVRRSTP